MGLASAMVLVGKVGKVGKVGMVGKVGKVGVVGVGVGVGLLGGDGL
jgi:hypothetical protein